MTSTSHHNKPKLHFYSTYRFRPHEKDPVIDQIRTLMEDTGTKVRQLHTATGLSETTVRNWLDGPTLKPQYASICAAVRGMGYEFVLVPARRKGNGKGWKATPPRIIKKFTINGRQVETL